jgi:hypothetical protein
MGSVRLRDIVLTTVVMTTFKSLKDLSQSFGELPCIH